MKCQVLFSVKNEKEKGDNLNEMSNLIYREKKINKKATIQ